MEKERLRTLIGIAMVSLGLVQTVSGVVQDNFPFAVFGFLYALIGVAYLWTEVYTDNQ
ncbi:hypothetical protein KY092_16195 [Natronomonas gomsonensis]|jgi:hypothetical protein|uniref:hypothetical protein n=1 Tax=Natronomonas gomsonensis TaxID=1046043 RepID=UPI0020CA853F|nr:hypothetical protein [Natronomonas gomsonensis]MCY4732104.1 hypothetical protein [Natronomonas gomsonensis]